MTILARVVIRARLVLIPIGLLLVAAACSDVPAPTSKGTRAVGAEIEEVGEAREVGKTKPGVIPDLIGVTVSDSRKALEKAGFKAEVDTEGLFATAEPNWLVCSQDPAAGETPKEGTKVALVADRTC